MVATLAESTLLYRTLDVDPQPIGRDSVDATLASGGR